MNHQTFPGAGRRYLADYGAVAFHVDFAVDSRGLRWADAAAQDFTAAARTETCSAAFVRPGVFWVTWKEADGTTVSHVEDFEQSGVLAAITLPNHDFPTLAGRWTEVERIG